MYSGSPKNSLDQDDLKKIGIGAVMAAIGGLTTYLSTVGPTIDQTTIQGTLLGVLASVAANVLRKYRAGP